MTTPHSDGHDHALVSNNPELLPPALRAVRHLIDFLQWRFSKLPAGAFRWLPENAESPDHNGSEIYISADTPLPAQSIGHRPGITVLRAQATDQGVGIGDVAFHDLATGSKSYMDLTPTTLIINVVSRLPFVAERLAAHCKTQVSAFREEIVKTEKCILYLGQRMSLGAPSPAGALVDTTDHDYIVVPVFVPTFLQHVTHKMPLNKPMLGSFKTTVRGR